MSVAHTLFGFDRLAHALGGGNPGYSTGATPRPSGRTHLLDSSTARTACGRSVGSMSVSLVPENVDESTWPVRIALCTSCRKAVK